MKRFAYFSFFPLLSVVSAEAVFRLHKSSRKAEGDFVCPSSLGTDATITRGISAVPSNWRVANK